MSKKIKKTKIPKNSSSKIKSTKPKPQGISFSLKYYQNKHDKFSCNEKTSIYWLTLIERLKALSGLSERELLINRSSALRFHPIKWDETSEKEFGLPNEKQLVDTPYQFSLSSNEHGRVHGFLLVKYFILSGLIPSIYCTRQKVNILAQPS